MQNYIYGAGGHGKVVLDAMLTASLDCAGFVDDKDISMWYGLSVFQLSELSQRTDKFLHLAIGNNRTRELIASKLTDINYFTVKHASAVVSPSAKVGLGTFLAAQCVVAPDAQVGNHSIINHSAVIDHDCVVGNFSHIAPQSSLGGGVKVGNGVLIGAGAVILPGVVVEDYAIIGAGAVVTKNVSSGVTVVGNPARIIK